MFLLQICFQTRFKNLGDFLSSAVDNHVASSRNIDNTCILQEETIQDKSLSFRLYAPGK